MLNQLNEWVSSLNTNMFFAGIMMLTLNIGSRYIQLNLSPSAESYLKYAITKEFLIFTIAWMGTRSIYVALTLTAAFIILSDYVLLKVFFLLTFILTIFAFIIIIRFVDVYMLIFFFYFFYFVLT